MLYSRKLGTLYLWRLLMLSQWNGFRGAKKEHADKLQHGLLGEEPVDLLVDVRPAEGSSQEHAVIEIPAENAAFVLRHFSRLDATEASSRIRSQLEEVRNSRQQKRLAKGGDWW
ncbi:MAG TPA: hypothetical protein DEA96_18535 [Leptospiraceae bacterium]|nr:hypothetical protein [Spirochaetaceae bacterium]HBS06975.1 hypothetical protein [Leptospiraceae bacterium]